MMEHVSLAANPLPKLVSQQYEVNAKVRKILVASYLLFSSFATSSIIFDITYFNNSAVSLCIFIEQQKSKHSCQWYNSSSSFSSSFQFYQGTANTQRTVHTQHAVQQVQPQINAHVASLPPGNACLQHLLPRSPCQAPWALQFCFCGGNTQPQICPLRFLKSTTSYC